MTAAHSFSTPRPARLRRPSGGALGLRALWLLLAWALGLALPGAAWAGALPGELPALVGRLSAVQGEVRWLDRDGGGWSAAEPGQPLRNWPVAAGDRLRTSADGRAELRIGSTTVRLGGDAELWLQRLDESALVLHLQAGTLALRLAAVDGDAFGPVALTTREGRWVPQAPGSYRLDRQTDATQATAWRGEWRFEGRDSSLVIPAGRRADLWLDGSDSATPDRTRFAWATVDRDAFADWVARDERGDEAPITARHVPPGMTGWQDLDRHGDWITDAELGSVWQPRVVAVGWAPYRDGRWAWVAPWGWTWIDAAPWGFAPFHYGSWVMLGGRWCWSPGPRSHRVRYAPVLSAWVGGGGLAIGVQVGGHRPPPPRVVVPVVVNRPRPVVVYGPPAWHRPLPGDHRPPLADPRGGDRVPPIARHGGPRDGRDQDRNDPRGEGRGDHRGDGRADRREPVRPEAREPLENRAGDRRADERRPDAPRGEDRRAPAVALVPAPLAAPAAPVPALTPPAPPAPPAPAAAVVPRQADAPRALAASPRAPRDNDGHRREADARREPGARDAREVPRQGDEGRSAAPPPRSQERWAGR